jgi:hypothetical protein
MGIKFGGLNPLAVPLNEIVVEPAKAFLILKNKEKKFVTLKRDKSLRNFLRGNLFFFILGSKIFFNDSPFKIVLN